MVFIAIMVIITAIQELLKIKVEVSVAKNWTQKSFENYELKFERDWKKLEWDMNMKVKFEWKQKLADFWNFEEENEGLSYL
jgi:hypothetical protein